MSFKTIIKQTMPIKIQKPIIYAVKSLNTLSVFTKDDAKLSIKPKIIPVAVTKGCLNA